MWGEAGSYFSSSKGEPFVLKINKTIPGNGVFTTWYTFAFTPREAYLLYREESGRHMRTKTYHYNKSGKIVRTETADRE